MTRQAMYVVDCVRNVMAHAQKPDFFFRRNGRVHLNQQGSQFNRLLAAEVCASAVAMLDAPSSEVVTGTGYPLHSPVSPSLPLTCVTACHHVSTGLYHITLWSLRVTLVAMETQRHPLCIISSYKVFCSDFLGNTWEFNGSKNIIVNLITVVCNCWLKL